MFRQSPVVLFDATAAGATLSGTLWPGTYTNTLPPLDSNQVTAITASGSTIGGVIAAGKNVPGYLIDFCAVGTAEQTLIVEIGKLGASGAIAQPLASVSIDSSTQTVANVNPYTGVAIATTTYRLFDTITVTAKGKFDQVTPSVGGSADDTPGQLLLTTLDGSYYYVVITTLPGALTEVLCMVTPVALAVAIQKAAP